MCSGSECQPDSRSFPLNNCQRGFLALSLSNTKGREVRSLWKAPEPFGYASSHTCHVSQAAKRFYEAKKCVGTVYHGLHSQDSPGLEQFVLRLAGIL